MNSSQLKRLAIGASLSLGGVQASAQTTFNIAHYNVSSGFAVGRSVRETPNGYIVFGIQTELDTVNQDCSVSSFNHSGVFVGEQYMHRSRFENYGVTDPIGNVPSGGYIGAQSTFSAGIPEDTVIAVRFNSQGDTLWSKPILSDTIAFVRKVVAKGGQFYFTGLKASGVLFGNHGFVIRTDSMADVELLHLNPGIDPYSLDVDDQGDMYIASSGGILSGSILKIDSSGNEMWQVYQPKPKGNWWGVKHVFGNKLLCMGQWIDFHAGWEPDTNRMYLCMYDDDGAFQWDFEGLKDNGSGNWATFTDGYQDSDSTFIVCGAIQQLAWNRAVIYRFTADGDSLWRRDYAHFANLANSTAFPEIPWDIEPTSDGGMVLTGETWNGDTIPPYSDQNLWLLKLDAQGCLVPGCQYVGINDIAYGLEYALRTWPNPSNGQVSLALDLPEGLPLDGHLLLQVFDAQGRLVVRRDLGTQLEQTIPLDLTGQPAGMYSAHISDAQRVLTGTKIVLE